MKVKTIILSALVFAGTLVGAQASENQNIHSVGFNSAQAQSVFLKFSFGPHYGHGYHKGYHSKKYGHYKGYGYGYSPYSRGFSRGYRRGWH